MDILKTKYMDEMDEYERGVLLSELKITQIEELLDQKESLNTYLEMCEHLKKKIEYIQKALVGLDKEVNNGSHPGIFSDVRYQVFTSISRMEKDDREFLTRMLLGTTVFREAVCNAMVHNLRAQRPDVLNALNVLGIDMYKEVNKILSIWGEIPANEGID